MGIKIWDFAFSTGMTTDYPVRRGWNEFMGVRELVQNALDIEERVFGYEGMEAKVWVDELGLHIADRGPGITYDAFKLGGSDKSCHERGFYGEGLKVAMAYFAYIECPVYVFNKKGQVFKCLISPGTSLVLIAVGRATPVVGTEAVVHGLPERRPTWADVSTVKRIIFKEWLKDPNYYVLSLKMRKTTACPVDRPNFIISHVDGKTDVDFLWVRDISVNKISTITGYPSLFGYNLWYVTLEPNRIAVSSVPELTKEAAQVFTAQAARTALDRVVENGQLKRGTFEAESVDWWYASGEVKTEVASWVKEHGYGWTDNERALDWALYLGVKPLLVPSTRLTSLFSEAQSLEDVIIVKGSERIATAEGNVVARENLTLKESCYLRAAEILLVNLHMTLFGRDSLAPVVVVAEKMDIGGAAVGEKIYIHRNCLVSAAEASETVLHEYAHYFGRRTYGEARDLSEAFERALGIIAAEVVNLPDEARLAYRRAKAGAWGARNVEWKAGRYRSVDPLSIRLIDALRHEFERLLNIPEARVTLDWRIRDDVDSVVPLIIMISLDDYNLDLIKKGGYFEVSYGNYDKRYYISDISDWHIPYPRFDLYMATLEKPLREKEAEKKTYTYYTHIIFFYDPEKDEYKVWSVIPRRT
jgi:hypothetical protein